MPSPMQRLIQSGVVVTLHRSDPGKRGINPLAQSKVVPGQYFSERGGTAENLQPLEVEGTATGTATWAAVWIEHEVWFTGSLKERVQVTPGVVVTFPRGRLKLGR